MPKDRPAEWFYDDRFWSELYGSMFSESRLGGADAGIENLIAWTKPAGRKVLDLCCGPGRCSIPLALRGYAVTGVDRSGFLLEQAPDMMFTNRAINATLSPAGMPMERLPIGQFTFTIRDRSPGG